MDAEADTQVSMLSLLSHPPSTFIFKMAQQSLRLMEIQDLTQQGCPLEAVCGACSSLPTMPINATTEGVSSSILMHHFRVHTFWKTQGTLACLSPPHDHRA